ncbi:MAG: hypothetical protein IPL84_07460 [Chitinophagaceae bacterium]|nr:hypothetical protein [Chitinophagaceae bacterium]
MQHEQQLSKEESLEIIHQMIGQAKTNITDNGLSWLLWGSLLFLTSLSTYIFIDIGSDNIYLGWNIFGLISILLLAYDIFKPKKKLVKTYIDDVLKWVDIGFMICLFTVILSINISVSPNVGFGFFLMIFAFLMIVKGGAIKSWALKAGALINWAGAIGIFFCTVFKYDMLIMAATILTGYILPGLVLWLQHKKSKKTL